MFRFIETICVAEGNPQALSYHCARVRRTLAAFDAAQPAQDAEELLAEAIDLALSPSTITSATTLNSTAPQGPCTGGEGPRWKLRLVYRVTPARHRTEPALEHVQVTSYTVPRIGSLRLVEGGDLTYAYKWHDRSAIERLYAQRGPCDEILISRRGRITDSSYCNVALFDGYAWRTPAAPLLAGTRRAQLLDHAGLSVADIRAEELRRYTHIALFNAMIGLGELVLPLSAIHR